MGKQLFSKIGTAFDREHCGQVIDRGDIQRWFAMDAQRRFAPRGRAIIDPNRGKITVRVASDVADHTERAFVGQCGGYRNVQALAEICGACADAPQGADNQASGNWPC